jgi:hypothetical protein
VTGGSYSRYSYDYTLVGGDLDSFQIKLSDALYASKKLDYEAKPSYKVMVRATSPDGKFFDSEIIVKVEDVTGIVDPNDSSIYLTLSRDSIQENLAIGTEIGTLQSNVINSQYSYSIIEGGENFGIQSGTYSFSSPVGTVLGTFTADSGNSLSVYLLGSAKSKAKKLFSIVDNKLVLKKTLGRKMRGQAVYLRVGGTVDGNIADDVYLTVRVN